MTKSEFLEIENKDGFNNAVLKLKKELDNNYDFVICEKYQIIDDLKDALDDWEFDYVRHITYDLQVLGNFWGDFDGYWLYDTWNWKISPIKSIDDIKQFFEKDGKENDN